MCSNRIRTIGLALTLICGLSFVAGAQDGWRWHAGISFRDFDDVEFEAVKLRNCGNTDPDAGPLGVQGYTDDTFIGGSFNGPFYPVHAQLAGVDADLDWYAAPVLGVERKVSSGDRLDLSFTANFQYYSHSGLDAGAGVFTVENYEHFADGTNGISRLTVNGPFDGLQNAEYVAVGLEIDADIFVLDAGLKASASPMDNLRCYAAGGPSVSIADIETARTESGEWPAMAGTTDTGGYQLKHSDGGTEFLPGGYIAAGVEYDFTEHFGIAAEYRYDHVFDSAGTDHAEIDLSGSSGLLKAFCNF